MRLSCCIASLLALLSVAPVSLAGVDLAVLSVAPARNATAASTATSVTVSFDAPVDAGSVDAASFKVYGRWSGPVSGSLSLDPGGTVLTFRPSRPFFPGEMVTVRMSSALNGTTSGALTGGHAYTFWVRSAEGNGQFSLEGTLPTKIAGEGFIQSYGIFAGDLDADGAPDLIIPNESADDVRVLMNDGCGAFSEPALNPLELFSTPSSNEGEDYDGDGLVDFAVANINGDSMSVFIGNGDGTFQPAVTYPSGNNARALTVLDAEGDGDIDIVIAHRSSSNLGLHRNNGDGTFAAVELFDGGVANETAISAADADNDGHMDLFVAGYGSSQVRVVLNDGTGVFTPAGLRATGANPWMTAVGDVDGDGNVDVATCNATGDNATVIRGDGAGGLLAGVNMPLGNFCLAIDLGDIDGDGDLDLVGSSFSDEIWTCYRNDGLGVFGDVFQLPATNAASCATLVDYDRDGFVDIVGIDELDDLVFLWRQDVPGPAGVQPPGCAATLRIDNLAHRAGFGGQPPHLVTPGGYVFTGVTARPGSSWWLTFGVPQEPGIVSAYGLYHFAGSPMILAGGITDAQGEALLSLDIPANIPTGIDVAVQVFVAVPGGYQLSNAEVLRAVP